jgi:hypothetical protein
MHPDLADWYRVVAIEPKAEDLQRRWQAIESLCESKTPSDLIELVRLFYGQPCRDSEFLAKFRSVFKAADEAFAMRDNDAEIRVLAGAALVRQFCHEEPWGTASALAVLSGFCQGLRTAPVPSIVSLAEQSLSERSASLRKPTVAVESTKTGFEAELTALKAVFPQNSVPNLAEPLTNVLQSLVNAIEQVIAKTSCLEAKQVLRTEESNVLWWLFGERSRDLNQPFSELKPPSACLVGAKELADLSASLCGPFAAKAFLDKMLRLAHPTIKAEVSIAESVDACPLEWQRRLVATDRVGFLADLCPVHLAVSKSVEAEGKNTWQYPFRTLSGLNPTAIIDPLGLAMQTYGERLLLQSLARLKEPVHA